MAPIERGFEQLAFTSLCQVCTQAPRPRGHAQALLS